MRIIIVILLSWFAVAAQAEDFTLTSSAFVNNHPIPAKYTCDGENLSPDLSWKNVPPNTDSLVLIMSIEDPVIEDYFYDWVIYNIPANIITLPEGANVNLPGETLVGNNSNEDATYYGPCPPDEKVHHYLFTLYALDEELELVGRAEVDEVRSAMRNHILKKAELVGTYNH